MQRVQQKCAVVGIIRQSGCRVQQGSERKKFSSKIMGGKCLINGLNGGIRCKTTLKRESLVGTCKSDVKCPSVRMLI